MSHRNIRIKSWWGPSPVEKLSTLLPLAALGFLAFFRVTVAAEKPNILLIYSDDHGWADLGAQGVDTDIKTPNLDQLARDGVRFRRGYVSAPQCVPSRAGVLTGRYQQRFGVEDNNKGPLPVAELTIAERLRTAGYITGMIGKWHLDIGTKQAGTKESRILVEHMPHRQGFDEYWRGELKQYYASHDLNGQAFRDPPKMVPDDRFRVVVQTEAALSFLDRRAKQTDVPWFMYLAWFAPHVPLESPEPWFSKTSSRLPKERRQALAMIAAMDDGLGKIREKLKSMNQDKNTLIVFIGDNGAPTKPGAWDGSINAPLIGEKGMLTDGGLRVPFLAAWPTMIPAGIVYDKPVINLDIAATAVALARLSSDPQLDGANLIPFLTGDKTAAPHDALYWRWRSQAAILEFPYKLIWLGNRERFLFDVTRPDGETVKHNLLHEHPEIVERLTAKWNEWSKNLTPPGPPEGGNDQDNYFFARHVEENSEAEAVRRSDRKKKADGDRGRTAWVCRNGSLVLKEGRLDVLPVSSAKTGPFLALSSLNIPGPGTVKIELQSTVAGRAAVAWRTTGQADFVGENRIDFSIGGRDRESHELPIPTTETIIHLRLHLPKGECSIRDFNIVTADGQTQSLLE